MADEFEIVLNLIVSIKQQYPRKKTITIAIYSISVQHVLMVSYFNKAGRDVFSRGKRLYIYTIEATEESFTIWRTNGGQHLSWQNMYTIN